MACTVSCRNGVESLVSMGDAFKPVMTDARLSVRDVFNPEFARGDHTTSHTLVNRHMRQQFNFYFDAINVDSSPVRGTKQDFAAER